MKTICLLVFAGLLAGCSHSATPATTATSASGDAAPAAGAAPAAAPLTLLTHYDLTGAPAGHFDHLAVDVTGHRLFSADEGGVIEVVDLGNGHILHTITTVKEPHAILYRPDLDRIFVTDGEAGLLRIYSGKTYQQVGSVKLWADADSIGYNPANRLLFVDSGGGDLHQTFSHFSAIDTTHAKLVHDMHIDADTLEAMQIAQDNSRIYLNLRSKAAVAVIDPQTHKVEAVWKIDGADNNTAMALDAADHLLFVGCRSGKLVAFDTETGKQVLSLPLGKMVDDMVYDAAAHRLYAACDGDVYVYQQQSPTQYDTQVVKSATLGKTALLVPSLSRYFVAVPMAGNTPAQILVYKVN